MSELIHLLKGRFTVLLMLLCFNLLVLPVIDYGFFGDLLARVFMSLLIVACADLYGKTRRKFAVGLVLAAPTLVLGWVCLFMPRMDLMLAQFLFGAVLFFFQAARMMVCVRKDHIGSGQSIVGAMSVYLLLGLAWTLVYAAICTVDPGAFSVRVFDLDRPISPDGELHASFSQLSYFSITTITTLGYGDIVPRTPLARSLAMCEVLTGVTYLAVVLSVLVGMLGRKDRHGHHSHSAQHPEVPREGPSASSQV